MHVRLVHEFKFESAHRLPKVPPGHKCANLHGHSFKVEFSVEGLENPTSEILAKWIWDRMKPVLPSLTRVTLWETSDARCEYEGG